MYAPSLFLITNTLQLMFNLLTTAFFWEKNVLNYYVNNYHSDIFI